MNRNDFLDKLSNGRKYEHEYGAMYETKGYEVKYNDDNKHDIQISMTGTSKTYEVKSDQKSQYTGNWAFEYEQGEDKTPSGLQVSTSDYWVQYSHEHYHVWCTSDLKEYVLSSTHPSVIGGDNLNRMYLVNVNKMKNELPPIKIIKSKNS